MFHEFGLEGWELAFGPIDDKVMRTLHSQVGPVVQRQNQLSMNAEANRQQAAKRAAEALLLIF